MILPTRQLRNADGHWEIVRVLSETGLEDWNADDPLAFEASLVWVVPFESLDYVRVATVREARSRRGSLALDGQAVCVGYSKLTANAPRDPRTGLYTRRVFYLLPEDFGRNLIDIPAGAVDPCSILPGRRGTTPDVSEVLKGYPKHLRQLRTSILRNPVDIGPLVAERQQVALAQ